MKFYFKNIFFLILTILLFLSATIIRHYSDRVINKFNYEEVLKKIQENTDLSIKQVENDAKLISDVIGQNESLSFSLLLKKTHYPYYVLSEGKLIFWSTSHYVPDLVFFADSAKYSLIEERHSKFLRYYKQVFSLSKKSYNLYFFIPLFTKSSIQNDYVSSSFNCQIFNTKLETTISGVFTVQSILSPEKKPLYTVTFNNSNDWISTNIQQIIFVLTLAYLMCICLYAGLWSNYFFLQKQYYKGIITVILLIISIKFILIKFNFPFSIIPFDLFNSKFFASSIISPSLGDLIFNALGVFILSLLIFKYFFKLSFVKQLLKLNKTKKNLLSLVLIVLSQGLYAIVYSTFRIINQHSQWTFDITTTIDFNYFRSLSLFIFLIISISFFCINHLLIRLYLAFNKDNFTNYITIALLGSLLSPIIFWGDKNFYWPLILLNSLFIGMQVKLHMPRFLSKIKYSSYVYFIAVAMMCSIAGALAIYKINKQRNVVDKNKFASQVLIESDVLQEYLLNDIHKKILNDPFIRNTLASPLSSKEIIFQKIQRVYLANYFEKFDIKVSVYNPFGESFFYDDDYQFYNNAIKKLGRQKFITEYKDVFFIKTPTLQDLPTYAVFNKIVRNNIPVGYILIQLKTKKIIPYSVFPELLVDSKFSSLNQPKSYSYAIFYKDKLQSNYGLVNYEKIFSKTWLHKTELYKEGLNLNGLDHIGFKDPNTKRLIVVSSESYSWLKICSNFSFLFILFLIFISAYLFVIRILGIQKSILVSYTSKIQIYMNIAFFLPLFVIALTTLSVITNMYKNNLNMAFTKKAENIGNRISIFFEEYKRAKIKKEELNAFVQQLSKFTESDVNFYNVNGILISTNQPLIYQNGLISKYLNPEAISEIKEHRNSMAMFTEQVGNLSYHAVYLAVKAYDSGKLIGIISIPFFESRQELEKQIIQVFTTIINIFSSIFILFLILSYFVSRALTVPLKLITHTIKKTSFGNINEPIIWQSKDEIGLLVGEYNTMLEKLEISKEVIRNNEKESAWREMAQQVAHEIKNPLTPMKLTLQYLMKNILIQSDATHERIYKSLDTILYQIDTLNEIATSFSNFAKLRIPKNDKFDILPLLRQSVNLFNNAVENIKTVSLPAGKYYVNGDTQMVNGIFSNILINAVQSIPKDKVPNISILGEVINGTIVIEFKDNGMGIPEELHTRIFEPHFSTKYTGSGIGLALVKNSVQHLGGKIWFTSIANEGTSFFIQLPLNKFDKLN